MSDILKTICDKKKMRVDARALKLPQSVLQAECDALDYTPRGFINALQKDYSNKGASLIAEIKKASPSAGLIRDPFMPANIARSYESAGASCLSVLTEEDYFQGSDDYLKQARLACALPVLRKDFIVDSYQILEARVIEADCILLIVAALNDRELHEFHELALRYGIDVLVEVHNKEELDRALTIPNLTLLGVNNRNLKTMNVDIQTSLDLYLHIPEHIFTVSESGISNTDSLKSLIDAGYQGFLIGEHFMLQDDIEQSVRSLFS